MIPSFLVGEPETYPAGNTYMEPEKIKSRVGYLVDFYKELAVLGNSA
jgi:hypothetical protein